jgi:hypothetical protein
VRLVGCVVGEVEGVATCDFGWNEGSVALDLR